MHADPELLGLLALGEHAGTEDERNHARTCPECADELSQLQRLTTLARSLDAETTMATPSEAVWGRIHAELALDPALASPADRAMAPPEPLEPIVVAPSVGPVHRIAPQGRHAWHTLRSGVRAAIARAASAAQHGPTARARLTPVDTSWSQAWGTAELATDDRGRRLLQVALSAELPTSGVRQAWLVHRDDPTLRQTLGILDGPHGLWTVEQSIDLEKYAILDISQQGTGETEHSGQTIVRGEFTLVS